MSDDMGDDRLDRDVMATDDAPMSAAQMLELSRAQQQRVADFFETPTLIIVATWGVAWFVGFLALWLGRPASVLPIPGDIAGTAFAVLMIVGVVTSVVVGSRTGAGVKGRERFEGAVYGISWGAACTAVPVLGGALQRAGMTTDVAALFYPAAYCIVIGTLYLVGAALWQDRSMIVVGAWILLVGVVAPYFGAPASYLVMSLAGGGAFLVYAALLLGARSRVKRSRVVRPS
ncbi:hypothetical protein [Labedella phragmitis]|uniref:hypothetical protein n=1 Tax=Labedella phragmitis TaxID=2498849 RepID=UPI001FB84655|nr:hypothetical protein [Labedella phragmitis]